VKYGFITTKGMGSFFTLFQLIFPDYFDQGWLIIASLDRWCLDMIKLV
jgi:hypothetical protein